MAGLLKAVAAPLFLLLALTFETMAIQRIPAGGGPTGIVEKDGDGKPTAEFIWQRIAANSFEQTAMKLGTALALFSCGRINGADDDAEAGYAAGQFAVAAVYMYIIGRPLFAIGYLTSDENNRLPGLFIGGFWLNLGYLLYATLKICFSLDLFYPCVVGCPVLTAIVIFLVLPSAESGSAGEKEAIATKEPSA